MGCCPLAQAFPQGGVSAENQVARWSRATPDLPLFEFFRGLPGRGPKFPGRSRQHLGLGRGPAFQICKRKISSVQQGPLLNGGTHGYIDILKDFTGRDSLRTVGGLHKIVAFLSAMFTSERIPELQGTGELPGPYHKSRPIDLPFVFYFPHFIPPLGEGISLGIGCKQNGCFLGWIFCEGENESTRD